MVIAAGSLRTCVMDVHTNCRRSKPEHKQGHVPAPISCLVWLSRDPCRKTLLPHNLNSTYPTYIYYGKDTGSGQRPMQIRSR
jgi:hypothetical protein